MAAAIQPISATSASAVAQIWNSISISQSDNGRVAARQSQISADRLALEVAMENIRFHRGNPSLTQAFNASSRRNWYASERKEIELGEDVDGVESSRLSGESDRIGLANFDEETPFGDRYVII